MKKMKNLLSLVLALVMVMAMSLTAMAGEALPGEVKDSDAKLDDHDYVAYQIFTGTQNDVAGDAALGQIEWGNGVNSAALLTALQGEDAFKIGETNAFDGLTEAADVAKVIAEHSDWALDIARVISNNLTGEGIALKQEGDNLVPEASDVSLANGYYLIVDATEFSETDTNTVRNLALLQLTKEGNFEARVKTDIPSVEKKVDDVNDSDDSENAVVWQDSADYDIGDDVPFQLSGTLPQDYDRYDTYAFTFHDNQSTGLTFNKESVVVTVGAHTVVDGVPVITEHSVQGGYTVVTEGLSDGCTFEIVISDVKTLEVADGYTIQNGDTIIVRYTSELNNGAIIGSEGNPNEVYLEYSNNPNGEGTGKTPEDKVTVFTFELEVEKVDEEGNPLPGAQFTLEKWIDGDDLTTEGETEDGYWKEIAVKDSPKADDPMPKMLFEFEGIDAGRYRLSETKTPAGYNTIDPIYFVVTAEHDVESADPKLTKLLFAQANEMWEIQGKPTASFVPDMNRVGVVTTQVMNQKGVTLPETGGIGTTIFYVAGVILVIVAGVLLVTKKRMSKEQ